MDLSTQIALLGRLCGIAPEYWDNSGVRRLTSQATYQALLTAMDVPWEDPEQLSLEIARRRLRPWSGLVDALTLVYADTGPQRPIMAPWTPTPELPSLRVSGTIKDEGGQETTWEGSFSAPHSLVRREVHDPLWGPGWRTRLQLPLPGGLQPGYYDLSLEVEAGGRVEPGETRLLVAPSRAYLPPSLAGGEKLWGLNLPLYALKSERNWGIGDFTDLKETIDWAGELGAAFVGVNPLHARLPGAEADPSPYSPSTRIFRNFLYLDLESVPEFQASRKAQALWASPETQALKARVRAADLVDYAEVYRLKNQVLDLLFPTFLELHGPPDNPRTARGREFARFVAAGMLPLRRFGQYNALADYLGDYDWRRWPREYQHPENPAVAGFSQKHQEAIYGQQYGQWLVAEQLAAVEAAARKEGLPFTLYQDLALGAHGGGAETWAHPHLFAHGADMGAPPDAFNPRGQNWALPPLIPQRLRQEGYRLFLDTLRANLPPGGLLRLDHVMGFFRLFWIPQGKSAIEGTYVHYPAREMLGILALESQRRRTLIIGEDLGTVPPRVRRELDRRGVLSYRVFYFERTGDGHFKDPADYPQNAMATVTTHDLPTLTGYWQGEDIKLKTELGLYPQASMAAEDTAARDWDRERLLEVAGSGGGAVPDGIQMMETTTFHSTPGKEKGTREPASCPEAVRFGVLEFLAKSKAVLLEVRLEEIFGVASPQNLPGTISDYPNWRRKLPLSLKEMRHNPAALRLAARLRKYRGEQASNQ
ncbi:MAG: 4-alpha-glucanotransferase [Thermodesulfobacteriota bacterium]